MRLEDIIFKQTCFACPEQYDAIDQSTSNIIGYLRLRHGCFTVEVPDVGGTLVYKSYPDGDGCFEENERMKELINACAAIAKYYNIK